MLAVYCMNIKCNGDSLIILPFRRRNDMVVFKNRIFSILAFSSSHQCFLIIDTVYNDQIGVLIIL